MTSVMTDRKVYFFKIYIIFCIAFFPWDIFKWFMSASTSIMLVWWLLLAKNQGYFSKLKELFSNKPIFIYIIFIVYAYLSLLWSSNISEGLKFLGQYKYFFILIPVIFTVFNKEDIILALKTFVISLGLYAILSLTIFAGFLQIANSNSLVPEGFMPYAVVTVYMALNTLFAFFFFLKSSSKKEKYLFFAIFILSLFALLVNNGRIGQLSFIATLFVLVIYYKDYFLQYKKTFFSFIFLIIVIVSSAYSFNKLDRYFKGFKELKIAISEDKYVGSFGARAYLWEVAYNNIPKNPIFGTGVGDDFDDIVEYYENNNSKRLLHPIVGYHNNHFLYLAKFGLFGYILFIVSIYFLLKSLYKNSKDYFVFGIIFISMVFFDSFGDVILHYKPFNNVYVVLFLFFAILGKNINKVKI